MYVYYYFICLFIISVVYDCSFGQGGALRAAPWPADRGVHPQRGIHIDNHIHICREREIDVYTYMYIYIYI